MTLVAQEEEKKKKGPSFAIQAAALLVGTALAVGMGWYTGGYLEARRPPAADEGPDTIKDKGAPHRAKPEESEEGAPVLPNLLPLDPITTTLADPTEIWVRLELSIVFDGEPDPILAHAIHQDLFAYMRTVKLKQIESASGFQHLKEDLRERARIRSDGRVKDVLFTTFLYE